MAILDFHPHLALLVKRNLANPVHTGPERRASLKDMIEACGVPHTEVAEATSGGRRVGLDHIPGTDETLRIEPWPWPVDPEPWGIAESPPRFIADINVARLGRYLRLCGFDTMIEPEENDGDLAAAGRREKRILLSRDRGLLMRKVVDRGHLVREDNPVKQLGEIVSFFDLGKTLCPFSRCAACNRETIAVEKQEIMDRLEPLTRRYYHRFRRCPGCGRIFWAGSHQEKIRSLIAAALQYRKPVTMEMTP